MPSVLHRLVGALRAQVLLSPAVQGVNAVCTAAALVLAASKGQHADIAAFTAGTALTAFLAVLVGGGTSLVYASGGVSERVAVRAVRWRMVAPAMAIAGVSATFAYHLSVPHLALWALFAGAGTVILNNLVGLEAASLQRTGRMLDWAFASVASRLATVSLVALGWSYSLAMVSAAVICLTSCWLLARADREAESRRIALPQAMKLAYRPSFGLLALLDVVMLRMPFVVGPLIAGPHHAGIFAAMLSAAQAGTALITAALYTIMTMRSGGGTTAPHARIERILILGATPLAILGCSLAPVARNLLDAKGMESATLIWVLLLAALPFVVINRGSQYRFITQGRAAASAVLLGTICSTLCAIAVAALILASLEVLAFGVLVSEAAGSTYLLLRVYRERRSLPTAAVDRELGRL